MKTDLKDPVEKIVVEVYVNAILASFSSAEREYLAHKLLHTYQVVQVAKKLVSYQKPPLSKSDQQTVIDCAFLHDIGRTRQYKKGVYDSSVKHGIVGSKLIKKLLPDHKIAEITTLFHDTAPSQKDPKKYAFYLNFVRDADMLANLYGSMDHMVQLIEHYRTVYIHKSDWDLYIDPEVICAAKEKRICNYGAFKRHNVLTMLIASLDWKFHLMLPASEKMLKKDKIILKIRNNILDYVLKQLTGTKSEKSKTYRLILNIYPDEY